MLEASFLFNFSASKGHPLSLLASVSEFIQTSVFSSRTWNGLPFFPPNYVYVGYDKSVKSIDREPFLITKGRPVGVRPASKRRYSTITRPMSSLR